MRASEPQAFKLSDITRAVRERWPLLVCATSFFVIAPSVVASEESDKDTGGSNAAAQKSSPSDKTAVTLDLSKYTKQSLQTKMDTFVSPECTPAAMVSCGWTVLSLVHSQPTTPKPVKPAPSNIIKSPADSPVAPKPKAVTPKPSQAKPGKRFSNNVPAGFEQFAELQQLEVDVHVADVEPFKAAISFNSSSFTFDEPDSVARLIAELGVGSFDELEPFILEEHPVSADDVCIDKDGPVDCVSREPVPYAILPKLNDARVDLVVRLSMRPSSNEADDRLPPASVGLSWQAAVEAAATAVSNQKPTADLNSRASVSYGAGGVFGSGAYNNEQNQYNVNELYFSHQFDDHQARIGTVEYQSKGFLLNQRLLGVSWARSLNTKTNLQSLFSTLVEVELTTRSVVQLVVDGVVYRTDKLDAGRHALNTSRLPDGTYEVEIRIRDSSNGSRIERQLFTSTALLPPTRIPLYGITAATGANSREEGMALISDQEKFLSGYIAKRLTENIGVRVESTHFADADAAQLQLIRVGNKIQLQVEGLVGSHSAIGKALRMAYLGQRINLQLYGLEFSSDADLQNDISLAKLFRPDVEQVGGAVGYRRGRYSLNFRADRANEEIDGVFEKRNRYSASLRKRLFDGALRGSAVELKYIDDRNEQEVELRFTLAGRDGDTTHRAIFEAEKKSNFGFEPKVSYTASIEPGSKDGFPEARRTIGRVEASATKYRTAIGAGVSLVDQHYQVSAGVDAIDEQFEELSFRGLLTGSAQVGGNANNYALGRNEGYSAGIIVDVKGEPKGAPYDIIVNGSRRSVGEIGTKQFVGLPSFNTHSIQLVPRSLTFSGFDQDIGSFTLYPGNVHEVQVEAENRFLLITTLVNNQQQRLTNVVVNNQGEQYFVLEDGIVQIEVKPFDELDIDLSDGTQCQVTVPDPLGEDVLIQAAPMICL